MNVDRIDLLSRLKKLEPGLSRKPLLEQSACFIFTDGAAHSYNDEVYCRVPIALPIKEAAVKAEPFLELLSSVDDPTISIEVEGGGLVVSMANRRAKFATEAIIFNPIESVKVPEDGWGAVPEDFEKALGLACETAAKTAAYIKWQCVRLCPSCVESTDTKQASRYQVELPIEQPLLILASSAKSLIGFGVSEIASAEYWCHFRSSDGAVLSCRIWNEQYVNLDDVLKRTGEKLVLPAGLKGAAKRAGIFSEENLEGGYVRVSVQDGMMRVFGKGPSGKYEERLPVDYNGKLAFNISPKMLAELVERVEVCEVCDDLLVADAGKLQCAAALFAEQDDDVEW